jgi:hypothetical protein
MLYPIPLFDKLSKVKSPGGDEIICVKRVERKKIDDITLKHL